VNRNQIIAIAVAAANIVLMLAFPPFDTYLNAKTQMPVFSGFSFYLGHGPDMIVNTSLLFIELVVVLINTFIGILLLADRRLDLSQNRMRLQRATLIVVAVNLVVIVLFPPFESVFAITRASLPSFEGFYFLFARQPHHMVVTAILYIEVMFVLANGALFWLIFRDKRELVASPEMQSRLLERMRKRTV